MKRVPVLLRRASRRLWPADQGGRLLLVLVKDGPGRLPPLPPGVHYHPALAALLENRVAHVEVKGGIVVAVYALAVVRRMGHGVQQLGRVGAAKGLLWLLVVVVHVIGALPAWYGGVRYGISVL